MSLAGVGFRAAIDRVKRLLRIEFARPAQSRELARIRPCRSG